MIWAIFSILVLVGILPSAIGTDVGAELRATASAWYLRDVAPARSLEEHRRLTQFDQTHTWTEADLVIPSKFAAMYWAAAKQSDLSVLIEFGNFRAQYVDALVAKIMGEVCANCFAEYFGSSDPGSDRDITVRGQRADMVVTKFNEAFRQAWGKTSAYVFDANVYGFMWVDYVKNYPTPTNCLQPLLLPAESGFGDSQADRLALTLNDTAVIALDQKKQHAFAFLKLYLSLRELGRLIYGPKLSYQDVNLPNCAALAPSSGEECLTSKQFEDAVKAEITKTTKTVGLDAFESTFADAKAMAVSLYTHPCVDRPHFCVDGVMNTDNDTVHNIMYAEKLNELYTSLNDPAAVNDTRCHEIKSIASTANFYAKGTLWTRGALDHVVSNIQAMMSVSLTKDEYLDSFLENTAGMINDLIGKRGKDQEVDSYQVYSSKHLSRAVQAASVILLDDTSSSATTQLNKDLNCLAVPAETLRKRIRNKGVGRTLAVTAAHYLHALETCWVQQLGIDETEGEHMVEYTDAFDGIVKMAAKVIAYFYTATHAQCTYGGIVAPVCEQLPILPEKGDTMQKCAEGTFALTCPETPPRCTFSNASQPDISEEANEPEVSKTSSTNEPDVTNISSTNKLAEVSKDASKASSMLAWATLVKMLCFACAMRCCLT